MQEVTHKVKGDAMIRWNLVWRTALYRDQKIPKDSRFLNLWNKSFLLFSITYKTKTYLEIYKT